MLNSSSPKADLSHLVRADQLEGVPPSIHQEEEMEGPSGPITEAELKAEEAKGNFVG